MVTLELDAAPWHPFRGDLQEKKWAIFQHEDGLSHRIQVCDVLTEKFVIICVSGTSVYKYFLNDDSKTDNIHRISLLSKVLDLMSLFESMNYSPPKTTNPRKSRDFDAKLISF